MFTIKKLNLIRKEVETIDKKILELLTERFQATDKIQTIKTELGLKITQKGRETGLLEKYTQKAKEYGLPSDLIKKIFKMVFSYSKKTGIIKGI